MAETARALGMPGQIEWQGRTLKVSRVTFKIEALFENWLEANRDRALERARARMSPEAYADRLRTANAEDGARAFAWTGDVARLASRSPEGFRELAFLCISDLQHDWTRRQHEELLEDLDRFRELVAIIHRVTEPLPNGSAPAVDPPAGASS